ncbi:PAS domain-containing sensor histidine kinase [Sphingosinicella sp. CPCC 101087]|uniref:hybrid sensor histidine kinase/response regulator n=1 Tax=Sphingosinicella sp. CPCC 101087 TaxID=2497754 RepID=UPI00101D3700|nr:PAS domain-containing sensor histidine kinase [Sphingosinicella sp. CPCC 101087]
MIHSEQPSSTEGRFELLVQSIIDYAIYMLDPTGKVTSWNAGARRFKGYESDEIIGEHFSRFYTDKDREREIPRIALETAEREGRFEAEGWRVRKDGTRFWANVVIDAIRDRHGNLVGFAKVTRDLTERKAAEEELRRSEERFRLLVESVTDYAIYMLDPEGKISSWNAGAARFKGYQADEIIGEHFSRFYSEEDRAAGIPKIALQTAEREGRFEAEGWRMRKDGTRFWANVVIDPIKTPDGRLLGFAKITRDLTERKHAQEELEKTREAFFQAQKMEAVGKLTGGVAHDFNNLLSVVLGSLTLAQRRLQQGVDVSGLITNAIKAAERGASLTQRMLAFARKQELALEAVDLSDLVRGMAELLQRTIGPGVTIDTRFPLILPHVQADARQLELALLNLVVNARDAMPHGGTITIAAQRESVVAPEDDLEAGDYVRLSVTDPGEGMDEQTLAQAPEPFFTTKGVGKGTGLGLPMVHGLARQCGGKFVLSSDPGSGTTAEIWLRVDTTEAESDQGAAPAEPEDAVTVDSLVILAVDDDPLVLENTAAMLMELGHEVLQAHSGPEALQMLDRHNVDLIITDYAMPGMTGEELTQHILASQPTLPVLMVSGYASLPEGAGTSVPKLGKPFKEHDLSRAISDVIAVKRAA